MSPIDLNYSPDPDWNRLRKALKRDGEPDRVPLYELTISFDIMEQVLGRSRPEKPEKEMPSEWARFRTDFYYKTGYDFVGVGTPTGFQGKRPVSDSSNTLRGIIHDRKSFEAYPWPEITEEALRCVHEAAAVLPEGMKVRPRGMGGILATTVRLMGFEGLSFALVDDPELVRMVTTEIGQRSEKLFDLYAQVEDVDFITLGDDMGFKTSTMFSPDMLREFILPWHKKIVQTIHVKGKVAILHSDGNLEKIMDDVIACGWDARHSIEDQIITAPESKKRWGNRIAICGAFDMDRLARSTPDEVREHTQHLIRTCAPGGSWAFGTGNAVSSFVAVENYAAMLEAAREFGRYE
mgnify:CR=1 FL=1